MFSEGVEMAEAENINFSLNIPSEDNKTTNRNIKNTKLSDVINFIKDKKLPMEIENKLIKLANKTPYGSLNNFKKNYKKYITK
jgi:hypothetical protein